YLDTVQVPQDPSVLAGWISGIETAGWYDGAAFELLWSVVAHELGVNLLVLDAAGVHNVNAGAADRRMVAHLGDRLREGGHRFAAVMLFGEDRVVVASAASSAYRNGAAELLALDAAVAKLRASRDGLAAGFVAVINGPGAPAGLAAAWQGLSAA